MSPERRRPPKPAAGDEKRQSPRGGSAADAGRSDASRADAGRSDASRADAGRAASRTGADPLAEYRRRRRAERTPEPVPVVRRHGRVPAHALSFVVQAHDARRFHHDFRLERDGVLVSWAVPKGVPVEPGGANRLAVQTEDHPLEYAAFQGEIPAGEYGAGTVEIFDHGTYEPEKWDDHEVKVVLHGDRLQGTYVLIHTDARNWLLHKMSR